MLHKIIDYLSNNGHIFMITGFIMAVVSILVYIQTRYQGNITPQIAFGLTITGFIVYLIGRIFMANRKIRQKKTSYSDLSSKDDV